jgi:hypothetical protein
VNSIDLTTFGAASLWLIGKSIDSLRLAATGAGQWLGSAPPALAAGG